MTQLFFLKIGPTPASFLFIFGLFQTNNTIFTTNELTQLLREAKKITTLLKNQLSLARAMIHNMEAF